MDDLDRAIKDLGRIRDARKRLKSQYGEIIRLTADAAGGGLQTGASQAAEGNSTLGRSDANEQEADRRQ